MQCNDAIITSIYNRSPFISHSLPTHWHIHIPSFTRPFSILTVHFPLQQEEIAKRSAQYQHLTNMELISLLLQQEMDMQKQQVAYEQQETQLRKCEAELKKVKLQVRDLEDYIDNLLLRIMEQTPTLLQVRQRHKW